MSAYSTVQVDDVQQQQQGEGSEEQEEEEKVVLGVNLVIEHHDDMQLPQQEEEQSKSDLKRFAKLSAPNAIVMFLMFLANTATSQLASKHLGSAEMSGFSLASLTAGLSFLTIMYGLLTAIETLAPQSYGAGNYVEVGNLVQRGFLAISLFLPFILFIFFNAESILISLGQPKTESALAGVFLKYHSISIPALMLWECSRRFLWSQNVKQWPFVFITILSVIIHVICINLFIPNLGFIGAPISHVITNWSLASMAILWIILGKPHQYETWRWMNMKTLFNKQALYQYFRLGLPGILSMSEFVFFQTFFFLSGLLGQKPLAANSIAYTLIPMMYVLPSSLVIGVTTGIGQLLAQRKVQAARKLSRSILYITLALASAIAIFVMSIQDLFIRSFSNDEEVIAIAKSIWIFVAIWLFLDSIYIVQGGFLRALSLQLVFAILVLVCLFMIGLPLYTSLAFPFGMNLGLIGMWIGFPISYVLLNISFFIAIYRKDWDAYSNTVAEREKNLKKILNVAVENEYPNESTVIV